MKIVSFALDGNRGWPDLELNALDAGLNVFCGPTGSSKTAVADLMSHALYGRRLSAVDSFDHLVSPEGEVVVESRGRKYRLRRYQDNAAADRLTVAALDGSAVDQDTVRQLVAGLSPSLLAPLFVAGFRESPRLEWLLSEEFAHEFQAVIGDGGDEPDHTDQDELVARRDALAHELETRIAGERQRSHELDDEWHELDRLVHEQQQEIEGAARSVAGRRRPSWPKSIRGCAIAIWERRPPERWRDAAPNDSHLRLAELDEQIDRWRQTLADMERRQASVQARMAGIAAGRRSGGGFARRSAGVAGGDARAGGRFAGRDARDSPGPVNRICACVAMLIHGCGRSSRHCGGSSIRSRRSPSSRSRRFERRICTKRPSIWRGRRRSCADS